MSANKKYEILFAMEKEKKALLVNVMSFFFSVIPTLINIFDKFWVVSETVVVPINALGVFTIGSHFTNTLDKVFKSIPKSKDTSTVELISNISFLVIYGIYIVVVPVCYFVNWNNRIVTTFSFVTLLLKAFQSMISMFVNIGNIKMFAKEL